MEFGPLELEACGENNFTMKALGQLAFHEELRRRFIRKLFGSGVISDDEESTILFFARVGLNFFREVAERELTLGETLDLRLNKALALPDGFRWSRNSDGKLTQPSQWSANHIQQMLANNGLSHDVTLRQRLADLQDVMNTEPDIVLQWGKHLAIVEIKVLSLESSGELRRQQHLAQFLGQVLGWEQHFALIGPGYGPHPTLPTFQFVTWATVAAWFKNEPYIASYIEAFAFFYKGQWRSMVQRPVKKPGTTAVDMWVGHTTAPVGPPPTPTLLVPLADGECSEDPMHFCHLGKPYFEAVLNRCWTLGYWPLRIIATGKTGHLPYKNHPNPHLVNWMATADDNRSCTNRDNIEAYNTANVMAWSADEIVTYFKIDIDGFGGATETQAT